MKRNLSILLSVFAIIIAIFSINGVAGAGPLTRALQGNGAPTMVSRAIASKVVE